VLGSNPNNLCGRTCDWSVTIRDTGEGKATLHVEMDPISVAGKPQSPSAAPWTIAFDVPGKTSWSGSATETAACGDFSRILLRAWATVGTATTHIKETSVDVSCFPILQ